MRLSENAHLLHYPHPSSLRRTSRYASFLGISEALHPDIFHQPLIRVATTAELEAWDAGFMGKGRGCSGSGKRAMINVR
ncbi:MAG: hypothetical protein AMK69_27720 [Nitrospira bacterium SG8_3]|nr:MAG: hypothetical protein AMK69_27720 [Nitrospira bacterium SG8_3]